MDVDDPLGEAVEERPRQQVHVAGADDELDAALLEPVGHRAVALLAARVVVEREGRGRDPGVSRALERGRPGRFDATAAIGRPASMSAWRFVPSPETRTPITRSPDLARVGVLGRHDGAEADPEVEDAPQLLLVDVAREPGEHGRPLPGVPVDARLEAVGDDARQVARGCRRR